MSNNRKILTTSDMTVNSYTRKCGDTRGSFAVVKIPSSKFANGSKSKSYRVVADETTPGGLLHLRVQLNLLTHRFLL